MVGDLGYWIGVILFFVFLAGCMIYVGVLIGVNHMKDDALDQLMQDQKKLGDDFGLLITVLGVRSSEDES